MTSDGSAAPVFPGATSVSELEVYDGVAPDGLAGGTPHLHVVSAEAYLVVAGRGRLHTIDGSGFAEHPLEPGSLVWFEPGVIHRAVNDGGLEVRVIMQNAGPLNTLTAPPAVRAAPPHRPWRGRPPAPGRSHRRR